ncbi:LysR substrate-binding domain-containing protein [Marinomonas mediterranea]|jgi:transcriptional regulator, LysR family|uniref:Transcriptional regulator, LysR family n=1 Tax=Marinomonas mediterranea (strain ATCC 700492 / JCM 21426 / NBRC 103028 / MMB-1) TaxID=717774 RepID=F2JUD5_MARM1|nr:LysR substrate-binding domain-containing protein [Marinomonas mediterranea]ADZ92754.1 transcriptional regulator, LysR family [Marinomonas mediterranea MMB-1]WCN10683.1 LysR family transcriptional regulator [Marinomonas mediterranea]WCN14740.1 LysR family transcriptional regulator [Marinomonas mediterranea]WCN18781.1 LysR family transcriptional regulator [Marinomonas mediterranea MMB-1]
MRHYIPSSTALKCFEASVRHLSFTRAAEELHLTQSAVSRQIRNLEEFLSRELFIRLNKRLVLTGTGDAYYKEILPLLDAMEGASLRMLRREDEKTTLRIASLPTLASYWLIPKLNEFQELHPEFQIKVSALESGAQIESDNTDIILHYGGDHWPKAISHHLMGEQVIAVCSPELIGLSSPRRSLPSSVDLKNKTVSANVLNYELIHLSARVNAWPDWFAANKLEQSALSGATFEHFHMLLEAAKQSMGAAILPTFIAEQSLARGELIAPFGDAIDTPHEYFLSYPADRADLEQVVMFRDWLIEKMRSS